jgi:hypothetical protein
MRTFFWFTLFAFALGCEAQPPAEEQRAASYNPPPQVNSSPQIEYQSDDDIGLIARVHFATHTPEKIYRP